MTLVAALIDWVHNEGHDAANENATGGLDASVLETERGCGISVGR